MPTGIIVTVLEIGCISSELFISGFNIFKCIDFLGLSFLSWMTIAVMLAVKKHCLLQARNNSSWAVLSTTQQTFLAGNR